MTVLSISSRAQTQVTTRRRIAVRPTSELTSMTRYRGGTYSHTVDTIVFTDGTSARTDLIRVNPNLHAYSLDFTGVAPDNPSRYRLATWSALPHLQARGRETEVDWILRNSFPTRSTAELSQHLRQAGYPLGPGNIGEHEAIAATQAAIWHFTNDLNLDNRALNVPIAIRRARGRVITFEFDGEPQLGGYSARVASDTSVGLKLQKSADGVAWHDISGSEMTVDAGNGRHQRTLGVGSTLSASSHGRLGRGYRYYRLVATTDAARPVIDRVRFWLTGTGHYRNADRVVHLYNYLLVGARKALRDALSNADVPDLVDIQATVDSELVGPFQVPIPLRLSVADGHALVDADGSNIAEIVHPGTDFYLRPTLGTWGTTITARTPHNLTGAVLTGVASEGAAQGFTPIALTVPTDVAIEFDITWQSCTDNV
jgi:TQXA domain-containing protein